MRRAAWAGCLYFVIGFLAGFMLGVLRVLVLAPRLGTTGAVLIELPVILLIAWVACRSLTTRLRVPPEPGARLIMGALAFALLLVAEFCSHGYSAVARTTSSRTSRPRRDCSAWPVRWSSPYCLPCNFCGEVGSLALDAASSDERRQPGSLYRFGQRRLTRCRLRSSGCSVSTKPRSRQSRRIAALRSSTSPKISPMLSVRA